MIYCHSERSEESLSRVMYGNTKGKILRFAQDDSKNQKKGKGASTLLIYSSPLRAGFFKNKLYIPASACDVNCKKILPEI